MAYRAGVRRRTPVVLPAHILLALLAEGGGLACAVPTDDHGVPVPPPWRPTHVSSQPAASPTSTPPSADPVPLRRSLRDDVGVSLVRGDVGSGCRRLGVGSRGWRRVYVPAMDVRDPVAASLAPRPGRARWALRSYLVEAPAATADEVAPLLWNPAVPADPALVFEQYRLCVELADQVGVRRTLANAVFLVLNTLVLAGVAVVWPDHIAAGPGAGWLLFPVVGLVAECLVWFFTVRSYRQVGGGRWAVVGALEAALPASPFWRAEWTTLGKGRDPTRYWPLSQVEQVVPLLFAATYVAGFLAVLIAGP